MINGLAAIRFPEAGKSRLEESSGQPKDTIHAATIRALMLAQNGDPFA